MRYMIKKSPAGLDQGAIIDSEFKARDLVFVLERNIDAYAIFYDVPIVQTYVQF